MTSGLILFNKPSGITSFDALRDIKRALKTGKVGHTGTLDKFASGLLIVLVGKALRLSKWFTHCDKKYTGKIHFGLETDTLDPEGEIIAQAALPSREDVEKILCQFTGKIMQSPPVYSAIHVNGKRASHLARAGDVPEMKKREVTIYKLELLSWQPPFAEIFVHCSSGTYIRCLARDVALAAGSRGYLCELKRTQVAEFELGMNSEECGMRSEELEEGSGESGIGNRDCRVGSRERGVGSQDSCSQSLRIPTRVDYEQGSPVPSPQSLFTINKSIINKLGLPWFEVNEQEAQDIFHGKPLELILNKKQLTNSTLNIPHSTQLIPSAAIFYSEELIAVIEKINGKWKYGCVIN